MTRRVAKEMSVEEFDAWSAARRRTAAVAESAGEDGGPRLSLVPVPDQQDAWPTDLLAPPPPTISPKRARPKAMSFQKAPGGETHETHDPPESLTPV